MKPIVCLIIAASLLFGYGCAKTDWIDRTLVTVGDWDVEEGGVHAPARAEAAGAKRQRVSPNACAWGPVLRAYRGKRDRRYLPL